MARQTLIHLHNSTRLTDASKLNLGEIAVRHAESKVDTELAVLTNEGALVYIPSLDKVTGLTTTIANNVTGLDTRLTTTEGKVTALETFRDSSAATKTYVDEAIAGLDANVDSTGGARVAVKVTEVDGKITAVTVTENDIAQASVVTALDSRVGANESAIGELQDAVGVGAGSGATLISRVSDLEEVLGDESEGLVKDVADNTAAISANTAAISANTASIAGHATKIGNLETSAHTHGNKTVLDGISADKVSAWDAAQANAIASAKSYTDGQINTTKTALEGQITAVVTTASENTAAIDALEGLVGSDSVATQISTAIAGLDATAGTTTISSGKHVAVEVIEVDGKVNTVNVNENDIASATELATVQSNVNTLIGSDNNMSAREIAAAEVAKVVADANADYDTLKEIADWILNDTTGAADMANDIAELQKVTSGYTTQGSIQTAIAAADKKASDNATAIKNLQDAVGGTDVAAQISAAIEGLDASETGAGAGSFVTVKVDQLNGVITGVTVTEKDIASANALASVKSTADTAVQTVTVSNLTNVEATKTGTAVTIDFANMVINCGTY